MRDYIARSAMVVGVVAGTMAGGTLTTAAHAPRHPVPPAISLHLVRNAAHGRPAVMLPRGRRAAEATAAGNLLYHGGPVQSAPAVFVLLWGSWWRSSCGTTAGNGVPDEQYLYSYFHALGGPDDGWLPISSQYSDKLGGAPAFPSTLWGGWAADCTDPPQSATSQQVADEAGSYARYLLAHGTAVGPDTQIIVVSPSGANPGGGFGTSYCAWHSWSSVSGSGNFAYINLPYLPDQAGTCGAGSVHGSLDAWSIVGGPEVAESATDPFANAWTDSSGQEIGGKCAWVGLFTESMGGNTYAQQSLWDNHTGSCKAAVTIPDTVTVSAVPAQAIRLGVTASLQVKASSSKGFSLAYSAKGLPAGLSISSAGLISGKPTWPGNFTVTVSVTDPTPAVGHAIFGWRVMPPAGPVRSYLHPAHCVADYQASLAAGTALDLEGCGTTLAQQWAGFPNHSLHRYGGAAHINTGRCMTIAGARTADGTRIDLMPCSGSWSQSWIYQPASHEWVNPQTAKCLTDPSGHLVTGTQLVLGTCNGTPAQQWTDV